jgi:hypothetical protein
LWTKNSCPPLSNSLSQASLITLSEALETLVKIDFLPKGGVDNIDISLTHESDIFKLLGIGVADIDKISILAFIDFNFSLSFTQNLCSSSTTIKPKSLKTTLSDKSL